MSTHADKPQENKSQSVANERVQQLNVDESSLQFVDARPEAIAQQKWQALANNSPQVSQLRALQNIANNSPQTTQAAQLQTTGHHHSAQQSQPIQKKNNNTGLPDDLKTGMENLSGMGLDHVKVHYNSPKPAAMQAHAYAQGGEIHLASGQEQHLPHELGHVVQQMQGRVQPTTSVGGMQVNDNPGLEYEATAMGNGALQRVAVESTTLGQGGRFGHIAQLRPALNGVVQCELSAAGRAYQDHVRDQDTPTWGSYVEAHAIASSRGFQTRVFQIVGGNLSLIDQVGTGDVRALSLLWHNDHYMVLNGGNALDGQPYAVGLVLHDPNPDGNCMYEAMFCIMRMGTAHVRGQLQDASYRRNAVTNMRGIAADNIDPALANMLGEDLQAGELSSEDPIAPGDQIQVAEISRHIMMFYKNYSPKTHYLLAEKKKMHFHQRSDDARVGDDVNTILVRECNLGGKAKLKEAVFGYLTKDRSYRYVKKTSAEEELTPFASMAEDEANGLYRVVRTNASKKIRLISGEKGFTEYSKGKSVDEAVNEAIDGLDLTGSISFKHSRHDFQPSGSSTLNLQVQLGGSQNYRVGKGDTSSTLVVIDITLFEENNRWKQIIQAAHRLSFTHSEKVEILPIKKK